MCCGITPTVTVVSSSQGRYSRGRVRAPERWRGRVRRAQKSAGLGPLCPRYPWVARIEQAERGVRAMRHNHCYRKRFGGQEGGRPALWPCSERGGHAARDPTVPPTTAPSLPVQQCGEARPDGVRCGAPEHDLRTRPPRSPPARAPVTPPRALLVSAPTPSEGSLRPPAPSAIQPGAGSRRCSPHRGGNVWWQQVRCGPVSSAPAPSHPNPTRPHRVLPGDRFGASAHRPEREIER